MQKKGKSIGGKSLRLSAWREMDDEDHTDLSAMFDKAGSNVTEHMASLWAQLPQLLRCKSKKAYCWHPR